MDNKESTAIENNPPPNLFMDPAFHQLDASTSDPNSLTEPAPQTRVAVFHSLHALGLY